MTENPQKSIQQKQIEMVDLGIVELEPRLEFTVDPLIQLYAAAAPADTTPNSNCFAQCNSHFLC